MYLFNNLDNLISENLKCTVGMLEKGQFISVGPREILRIIKSPKNTNQYVMLLY